MRIAIIPARGGSKRIPRKNVKEFLGTPLIAWSIGAAIESALFDHVVVSTDDAEIADVAVASGAEVPFMRPERLADDTTSTNEVLLHAVAQCETIYGSFFEGCCLYSSPLITPALLQRGFDLLSLHDASSTFPITSYEFPVEQAFTFDGGRVHARWPEKLAERSQDLREHYHDAGMFYWFRTARLVASGRLLTADTAAFVVPPTHCQDINTMEDWTLAELKVRLLREASRA